MCSSDLGTAYTVDFTMVSSSHHCHQISDLPNLYDYRYLIDTGAMERAAFDRLCAEMAALLPAE